MEEEEVLFLSPSSDEPHPPTEEEEEKEEEEEEEATDLLIFHALRSPIYFPPPQKCDLSRPALLLPYKEKRIESTPPHTTLHARFDK